MEKAQNGCEAVCLISHHPVALEGFERALAPTIARIETVRLESQLAPDLTAVELPSAPMYVVDSLPSPRATESLVSGIRENHAGARILVLADSFDEATAFTLLRLGVKGMLRYDDGEKQLPRAVGAVCEGGYWVSRALLSRFVDLMLGEVRTPPDIHLPTAVSPREREVLDALLQNLSNKEIGNRLNIAERTVKFHVSNLLQKFSVNRRADLILLCYQTHPREETRAD